MRINWECSADGFIHFCILQTKDDKTAIDIAIQYGADEAVMNALFKDSGKGKEYF